MVWQFMNSGFSDGRTNMHVDEDLARSLADGRGLSTVRVYGWTPPAISLGWNQAENEILAAKANTDGIDVVRRPTGGRAILHSGELTYSVVMTVADESVTGVYRWISEGLLAGLIRLGVPASLEKSQPHFPTLYHGEDAAACFASSARHEIKVAGKKLVGSAQRRYRRSDGMEVVLQHGSLLLDSSHRALVRYLDVSDGQRGRMDEMLTARTTDLSEILDRTPSFEEVARAVKEGMEEAWNIRFESEQESVAERSLA